MVTHSLETQALFTEENCTVLSSSGQLSSFCNRALIFDLVSKIQEMKTNSLEFHFFFFVCFILFGFVF